MELAACCLAWWNTDVKRQTNCQEINSKTCNSHSSFLESQHQSDLCIKTNRVVLPPIKKQKSYCPWCRRTCNWFHANLALPSSAIVYHANWRRMRLKSQCWLLEMMSLSSIISAALQAACLISKPRKRRFEKFNSLAAGEGITISLGQGQIAREKNFLVTCSTSECGIQKVSLHYNTIGKSGS